MSVRTTWRSDGPPATPSRRTSVAAHDGDRDAGFTLIELLVVVVVLGILIAIAIPVYLNYRRSANDRAAQSDLRGAISVLEQCYGDNGTYPASVAAGATAGGSGAACAGRTVNLSSGTTLSYYPVSGTDTSGYVIGATNSGGSATYYCYNSVRAGSVTTTRTPVTAYRASC